LTFEVGTEHQASGLASVFRESSVVGFAIRAAKFDLKPTRLFMQREKNTTTEYQRLEERGAFKGPIRIPLHSQLFLINALALPSIPSTSLKFRPVLFSTPTRFRQLLYS
jgi:hypothetical protein